MKIFSLAQEIHYADTFQEFAAQFDFCDTDLILTERVLYENYIRACNPACSILIKDDYSVSEPDEETVDRILEHLSGKKIERVIAIGGGSVIDIAKALIIRDAYPFGRILRKEVPVVADKTLIAIPTTCGTGSEITSSGIILQKGTGLKTIIPSNGLSSKTAVLIPEFIKGLPFRSFVYVSMDALSHAMESYLAKGYSTVFSRSVAGTAIELIVGNFVGIALNGAEFQKECARDAIFASTLAGISMTNSNCGPVHALAYPVGEKYHMSHGEGNYQFLTAVMELYQRKNPGGELLMRMKALLLPILKRFDASVTGETVFRVLTNVLNTALPQRGLHECGMTREDIEPFAQSIMETKMRLISPSYAPFTKQDAIDIYTARL